MSNILPAETVLRSRYRITDLIGRGGMGAVYEANDLRLTGRVCAVKEVIPNPSDTEEYRKQAQIAFRQEASTLARLDHINLPKVSDYFSEKGRDYLVMDFVPGHDLRELIEKARHRKTFIPEEQVLSWAKQIIDALEYLHTQTPPVLHRDIKPSNIKLTPSGIIKLVDFGLVKLMLPDDTKTVTVLQGQATIQYAPLEQIGGDAGHTDGRSDIYSLGATLYHLLTNEPPPDAKSRYVRGKQQASLTIRGLNPDVSGQTELAILHAMALHPEERPQDITEFKEKLLSSLPPYLQHHDLSNWRVVIWRNRLFLALIPSFLFLAALLTSL